MLLKLQEDTNQNRCPNKQQRKPCNDIKPKTHQQQIQQLYKSNQRITLKIIGFSHYINKCVADNKR